MAQVSGQCAFAVAAFSNHVGAPESFENTSQALPKSYVIISEHYP
ncbi:hypothetical protein L838_4386 [Mycobacterium avium MAV_120709_2344]|nr:hypothetical protein L838_4386 [Mycobacterium avium MAV_120709_2344]